MKLLKKSEVVASKMPLFVRCTNPDYVDDYIIITKIDNPEVIKLYTKQTFKQGEMIRYKDLLDKPTEVLKPSKKRKQVASESQKVVPKPFLEEEGY